MPHRVVTLQVPNDTKTMVVRLDVPQLIVKLEQLKDDLQPTKAVVYDNTKPPDDPNNAWALTIARRVRDIMVECSDSPEMQDDTYSFLAALSLIAMLRDGKPIPNQSIN